MPKIGTSRKTTKKQLYYPKKSYRNAIRILDNLAKHDKMTTQSIADNLGKRWSYPHKRTSQILENLVEFGYCQKFGVVYNLNHNCEYCNESTRYFVDWESLQTKISMIKENNKNKIKAKKDGTYNPKEFFDCDDGFALGRLLSLTCINCDKFIMQSKHNDEQYKPLQDIYWKLSNNGKFVMLGLWSGQKLFKFVEKNIGIEIFELVNALLKSGNKEFVSRLIRLVQKNMNDDPNILKYVELWYDGIKTTIYTMKVDENYELSDFKKKHRFELQTHYGNKLNKNVRFS
jgi:hypothetical protein